MTRKKMNRKNPKSVRALIEGHKIGADNKTITATATVIEIKAAMKAAMKVTIVMKVMIAALKTATATPHHNRKRRMTR